MLREATPSVTSGSDAAAIARAAKAVAATKSTLHAAGSMANAVDRCLECAAAVLAACAEIWMMRGPAAGAREDALLAALARRVDERVGAAASGERAAHVESAEVTDAAAAAIAGLRAIARRTGDAADALERLERSCLDLAMLAVQRAVDVSGRDGANGPPATVARDLRPLVDEVRRRASALRPTSPTDAGVVGESLAAALRTQPSWFSIETLEADDGSGPRADALLELRRMWIELAAHELLVVDALDRFVNTPAYERFESLDAAILEGGENVLVTTGVAAHPRAFDPGLAYARQFDALTHAVQAACGGLSGDRAAADHAQQIVLTRLLRAVAAAWATDAQLQTRASAG